MSKEKIDIGIKIDLETLLETKLLMEADSGSGKSWAIRKMAEECFGKVQQIIIDPEGDFITLREKYAFALVSKNGGDIPLSIRYAEALAHKILETGISFIIDLYEFKEHERQQFVKQFCEALMNAPKSLRHSCLVYLDEAQLFCPEDKRSISTNAVIDLCTRGRKRGLCAILATLRISILNKSAAAQCKNKMMGSTSLPLDQKRVGDELGFRTKDAIQDLRNLGKGDFWAFGPAISKETVKFKVGPVKTTHIKSGGKLLVLPPTPAAIKKILSKLEAIPEEAEKDLDTKKKLQDEVKRLTAELKKKPVVATGKTVIVPDERMKQENVSLKSQLQTEKNCYAALVKLVQLQDTRIQKIAKAFNEIPGVDIPVREVAKTFSQPITHSIPAVKSLSAPKVEYKAQSNGKQLPVGERSVLIACAQFPNGLRRDQITVITGYKRSTRDRYIQYLKEKGLMEQDGERLIPSQAGTSFLGDDFERLPTGEELQRYWLNKLPQGERVILENLISVYPAAMSRDQLTENTGYMRSTRDRYLQYMASKEIVIQVGRGEVKASDNLFN